MARVLKSFLRCTGQRVLKHQAVLQSSRQLAQQDFFFYACVCGVCQWGDECAARWTPVPCTSSSPHAFNGWTSRFFAG